METRLSHRSWLREGNHESHEIALTKLVLVRVASWTVFLNCELPRSIQVLSDVEVLLMITAEAAAQFNLYLVKSFFDVSTCHQIIAELSRSPVARATTYGRSESGYVDETVRRTTQVKPSTETVELVKKRLSDRRAEIGGHFGISLGNIEEPQFLRYCVGDFFVAHQDGNTGLLRLDREQSRKVSIIIFLNYQSEAPEAGAYGGGSLVFSEWRPGRTAGELRLSGEAGTLAAFPSDTTHEVIPVIHGERYSIVSWYG